MSTLSPILAGSAQSVEAYQQVIEQTSQAVVQWLKQPEMYQGKSVDELRERISLEFNEQGLGNQAAIDRAIEYFLKDSLSVHHPQCVAHLHCPSLVISQAAEVLINATNQSMDSWDQSPSATIIEIKLIEWLRAQVGYGAGDAGVFTSGGTQSNMMGLMIGIEIVKPNEAPDHMGCYPADGELSALLQKKCFEAGLILERGGRHGCVLRLLPSLLISNAELEIFFDKFEQALLAAGVKPV